MLLQGKDLDAHAVACKPKAPWWQCNRPAAKYAPWWAVLTSANQFNHATQGWRQPGSSFKPFIYAGAFDHGVMPDTIVNDAPITMWATGRPATRRQPLPHHPQRSPGPLLKNLVTIRLVSSCCAGPMRDWTMRFGLTASATPTT